MATDEIGMINRKKKLYQESLKNFRESYTIYEELKDSLSLVRAGQNIGQAYLFQNKWDSCYFYYTYALELARKSNIRLKFPFYMSWGYCTVPWEN